MMSIKQNVCVVLRKFTFTGWVEQPDVLIFLFVNVEAYFAEEVISPKYVTGQVFLADNFV